MSKSETDVQADLTEFDSVHEERPSWDPNPDEEPDTGARAPCEQCGETVSQAFARVFGNNEDEVVHGCPACSTAREFSGGTRQ